MSDHHELEGYRGKRRAQELVGGTVPLCIAVQLPYSTRVAAEWNIAMSELDDADEANMRAIDQLTDHEKEVLRNRSKTNRPDAETIKVLNKLVKIIETMALKKSRKPGSLDDAP